MKIVSQPCMARGCPIFLRLFFKTMKNIKIADSFLKIDSFYD